MVTFVLALALASSAPANDDAARTRAKALVQEGTRLYEQARYDEALEVFQDAAATWASPDFQFNIGLCHERMGDYDAAIRSFETYLRNKPEATDRPDVERRIEQMRQLKAAKAATATPSPTPVVEPEPPVSEAAAPVTATPPPESTSPPPPRASRVADDAAPGPDGRGRGATIAGGVLLGTGAALALGGGLGFGLPARDRATAVDDVLDGGNPDDRSLAQTQRLADEGDRLRGLQIGSIALGSALVVSGVVAVVVGRRRARAVAWAPMTGPATVGMSIGGRW